MRQVGPDLRELFDECNVGAFVVSLGLAWCPAILAQLQEGAHHGTCDVADWDLATG